jgi:hypothetical protein
MIRNWFRAAAVICLLQAMASRQLAGATDVALGEQRLPQDTFLFFAVPDVTEFQSQWKTSAFGKFIEDPEFQPFLDDIKNKLGDFLVNGYNDTFFISLLGVTLEELCNLPQGEVTLALMEQPAKKISAVVTLNYGENEETIEKLLQKMHESFEDLAEDSTEERDDVKINIFTFSDSMANSPFKTLAYFKHDKYIVFGTEVDALWEVLSRWKGDREDTLATNDVFKHCMDRCKDDSGAPAMKFFVNPFGMIQSALNMAQAVQPQVGMVAPFLPMLGIDKLKGWGGATYLSTADFDVVSKSFIYAETPTGILNVFQFPLTELTPPKWVRPDVSMYFGGNWDNAAAYQAVEGMVDMFQGRGALTKFMDKAEDSELGVHPKKDVLDLLDGKFHFVQSAVEGEDVEGEEAPAQNFFVGLSLKDAAQAKKMLAKLAQSEGYPVESREFNGETIYEIALSQEDQSMSYAVSEGHLIVTNSTQMLESMLRTSGSGALADSPEYNRISKHFPAKTSMISFQNSDAQLKRLYDWIKNANGQDFFEGIDVSQLPPFEVLQKHLRSSGSYIVPEKKGALMIGFQLKDGEH